MTNEIDAQSQYSDFNYALKHFADHTPLRLTGPIQYFPTILRRVTSFRECSFPGMGYIFQNVSFESCVFNGGVLQFDNCHLKSCSFGPSKDIENNIRINGGSLRGVTFRGIYDEFLFSPDYTEECVFEDGFFAFDLKLRLHCGIMAGVSLEGDVFWKFLAGMFYQKPNDVEDMGVSDPNAMEFFRKARREIKRMLISREGE